MFIASLLSVLYPIAWVYGFVKKTEIEALRAELAVKK